MEIKQHAKIKYLRRILDENLSGESIVLKAIDKISSSLTFLPR